MEKGEKSPSTGLGKKTQKLPPPQGWGLNMELMRGGFLNRFLGFARNDRAEIATRSATLRVNYQASQ